MNQEERARYLVETYADTILRLSYSYLKNTADAQDICQTVFLKLLTEPQEFASVAHERAWILRVAANQCKDLLKSHWRKRNCTLESCQEIAAPPEPDGTVMDAVNELPEKYRVAVELYYYEGYQAEEIAEILNISANAVYTRLARARKQLKWMLKGEAYGN